MSAYERAIMGGRISQAIYEARDEEKTRGIFHNSIVGDLLVDLSKKHPSRIYFDPNNPITLGFVLRYWEPGEEYPYGVYMGVCPVEGDQKIADWRISGSKDESPRDMEIERWKDTLGEGMLDLLKDPARKYRLPDYDDAFLHVSETASGLLVWRYHFTPQNHGIPVSGGVYFMDPSELPTEAQEISQTPQGVVDYGYASTITP